MPDITMCTGGECPKRDECYRHRARPANRQSYIGPAFFIQDEVYFCCAYLIVLLPTDALQKAEAGEARGFEFL